MSCLVISCHVLSYHVMSSHVFDAQCRPNLSLIPVILSIILMLPLVCAILTPLTFFPVLFFPISSSLLSYVLSCPLLFFPISFAFLFSSFLFPLLSSSFLSSSLLSSSLLFYFRLSTYHPSFFSIAFSLHPLLLISTSSSLNLHILVCFIDHFFLCPSLASYRSCIRSC